MFGVSEIHGSTFRNVLISINVLDYVALKVRELKGHRLLQICNGSLLLLLLLLLMLLSGF